MTTLVVKNKPAQRRQNKIQALKMSSRVHRSYGKGVKFLKCGNICTLSHEWPFGESPRGQT